MYKEIEMLTVDGETKKIPFKATGTTQIRYRTLFGSELMKDMAAVVEVMGAANTGNDNEVALEVAGSEELDSISKVGFIMNRQAEGVDLSNSTISDYFDWLDQFEPLEMLIHCNDILDTYLSSRQSTSTPKKKGGRQTEK